ncbi:hypothetical protein MKX03_027920 [Papaver bracteatum]|nr:hypothetical protein MKX03_027920 [Papaver bracteatum]
MHAIHDFLKLYKLLLNSQIIHFFTDKLWKCMLINNVFIMNPLQIFLQILNLSLGIAKNNHCEFSTSTDVNWTTYLYLGKQVSVVARYWRWYFDLCLQAVELELVVAKKPPQPTPELSDMKDAEQYAVKIAIQKIGIQRTPNDLAIEELCVCEDACW